MQPRPCSGLARAEACAISGSAVTLHGVTVQPKGVPALTVGFYDLSVIAKPSASASGAVHLQVEGAVAFRGQRRRLWYTVREPILATDGMLSLERGTQLVDARGSGTAVLASVVLRSGGRLEGTDLHPELVARSVRVSCSNLTLDSSFEELPSSPLGDGTWWVPRANTRTIVLRAAPEPQARTLLVSAVSPSGDRPFSFERVNQQRDWMQLAYAGQGAIVRGWVRGAEWASDPDDDDLASDRTTDSNLPNYEVHYTAPARYEGPARIAVGTAIYAQPGRGPWATVQHSEGFRVRDDGSTWVELSDIPGVAVEGGFAFVPRTAVVLQR